MGRQLFCASFLLLFLLVLGPSAGNTLATGVPAVTEEQRCQCVSVSSAFIPAKHLDSVSLIPPGSRCPVFQIIATLKNGRLVCLDSEARWVKGIIRFLMNKGNH